jgi:hypothetical protein
VTLDSAEINKNDPIEISVFIKLDNGEDAPVIPLKYPLLTFLGFSCIWKWRKTID